MPTLTIPYDTPDERRAYERAVAYVAELRQLGATAPHGGVVDACEAMTLSRGRDFLRDALADAVQARVDGVEKKSRRPAGIEPAARGGGPARS